MTMANDNAPPLAAISIADLAKALNISEDEVLQKLAEVLSARDGNPGDHDIRRQG